MADNINQPAHYTAGGIETIDVIEGVLGKYDHRDQVEKYNQRAHLKGNFKQDLEKARWYLNRTIENCEKGKLDPVTGTPVDTDDEEHETLFATNLDTDSVYKDEVNDLWVYNYPDEKWYFYTMRDREVVRKSVRGFTQKDMGVFSRDFFTRVEYKLPILLAVLRYETDNVEEEEEEIEVVLGETHAADMPVGTVAYRDGVEYTYSVRKEVDGWSHSNHPFFLYHDGIVDNWFKFEEGWMLDAPSDVYIDADGDYWANTGDGWRWYYINGGELEYTSIRKQELEDIMEVHSLQKLSGDEARRVRLIIREGEK